MKIIEWNPHRVANLLKAIVNQRCEEASGRFPNIGEMPSLRDIYYAIEILDSANIKRMMIYRRNDGRSD